MRARARVRNPFLDLHACLPPANRLVLHNLIDMQLISKLQHLLILVEILLNAL